MVYRKNNVGNQRQVQLMNSHDQLPELSLETWVRFQRWKSGQGCGCSILISGEPHIFLLRSASLPIEEDAEWWIMDHSIVLWEPTCSSHKNGVFNYTLHLLVLCRVAVGKPLPNVSWQHGRVDLPVLSHLFCGPVWFIVNSWCSEERGPGHIHPVCLSPLTLS